MNELCARKSLEAAAREHEIVQLCGAWVSDRRFLATSWAQVIAVDERDVLLAVFTNTHLQNYVYALCSIDAVSHVERDTKATRQRMGALKVQGLRGVTRKPWRAQSIPGEGLRNQFLRYLSRRGSPVCLHRVWAIPDAGRIAMVTRDLLAVRRPGEGNLRPREALIKVAEIALVYEEVVHATRGPGALPRDLAGSVGKACSQVTLERPRLRSVSFCTVLGGEA